MSKYDYTFKSSNGLSVTMKRGNTAPKMIGGGGGWDVIERPRRVSMTLWKGRDPYRMTVPVLFDGHAADESVETDISKLNQMQMGGDLKEPPTVMIDGAVPVKGIRWVIDNIEWGEEVFWEQEGSSKPYRTRQDAIVTLIQYNPEDRVKTANTNAKPTRYKTKTGQTLRQVAIAVYKDPDKWSQIAKAQTPPLRIMGSTPLKAGTDLRIP